MPKRKASYKATRTYTGSDLTKRQEWAKVWSQIGKAAGQRLRATGKA